MHNMLCAVTDVYLREIINTILVGQMSECVKNFDSVFSNTINIINLRLCMMVLTVELYMFISLSVTMTIFQAHRSVSFN